MGTFTYTRKTDNPKAAWSEERKAKASAKQKQMIADGTWFKMSKKQRSKNISKGLRDAAKRRNRSNGQLKRHWKKEADKFFSATEVNKRLNERKGEEQKAVMSQAPTTLSEDLLEKAVLPEKVLNGVAEVASDIKKGKDKKGKVSFPEPYEVWDNDQKKEFAEMISMVSHVLDQVELAFGGRPSLHTLIMTALDARLKKIFSLLGSYSSNRTEEDE
jgi:hypothetical protein